MDSDTQDSDSRFLRDLSFVGQLEGLVKRMGGFDKSRHTPPKFASDRAQQFLARLAEPELVEWGEEQFAAFRERLRYRRTDISLAVENGVARVEAKDFILERRYSLIEDEPGSYIAETELRDPGSADLLEEDGFNEAIGPQFERLRCVFKREASVEELIDGIEDAEEGKIEVKYPSTCEYCDARIEGLDALFRFDAATLEIRFPSYGMPRQLIGAYRSMADKLSEVAAFRDLLALR